MTRSVEALIAKRKEMEQKRKKKGAIYTSEDATEHAAAAPAVSESRVR